MSSWILTRGLQHLLNEIDYWAPDRDHTSDGTIGDQAHLAESHSGHDPDDVANSHAEWNGDPDKTPEVRAVDVDVDFRNGVPAQALVDHIVALKPSSVLRYVIYNRRIWEATNGWASRDYTGESAHTEHIHFSGAYSQAADNNSTFDFRLEEIPVALTAADKTWIQQQIAAVTAFDKPQDDGTPTSKIGRAALTQGVPNGTKSGAPRDQAWQVLEDLGVQLMGLRADVAAIEPASSVTIDYAALAQAIAAAIPAQLADQVADVLAQRLSA